MGLKLKISEKKLGFELFSLKMTLQPKGAKNIQSGKIHIVSCLS